MSIFIIPWAVAFVAAIIAWVQPIGRDLAVPVFLLPWATLRIDVGANIKVSQIILILLIIKYIINSQVKFRKIVGYNALTGLIVVGLFASIITFSVYDSSIIISGGSLRNGPLRMFVSLVVFMLSLAPFVLLNVKNKNIYNYYLIKIYINSVLILCVLGALQFIVFNINGIDLFPIWMFDASREVFVTGKVGEFGNWMRPSSLSGEPKGLAMMIVVALILLIAFGSRVYQKKSKYYRNISIFFVTMILTASSSAFVSIGISIVVIMGLRLYGRPIRSGAVLIAYTVGAIAITSVMFNNVANIPLSRDRGVIPELAGVSDMIYYRTIGRFEVEDMDWVIIKSFIDDLPGLMFGRGFGLGHLFVDQYIPTTNSYMLGTVVSPKSGLVLLLANGGIIGLALFIVFLAKITPSPNQYGNRINKFGTEKTQIIVITLVVVLLLRTYVFEVSLFIFAVINAVARSNVAPKIRQAPYVQRKSSNSSYLK